MPAWPTSYLTNAADLACPGQIFTMAKSKYEMSSESSPHILIQNVSKTYASPSGDVLALTDVSLNIRNGEFISLLGPSGSERAHC